jgi:hypothetical protein
LIHFELILTQGDKDRYGFSFLLADNHFFPGTFVEEPVFSPLYVYGTFVRNNVGIAVWIHIQVLHSVPLVFISNFVQYHAVFIAIAL